jgi:uncharacterized membrane protein
MPKDPPEIVAENLDQVLGPAPEPPHHPKLNRFRNTIMAGLTFIAPLSITLWALKLLFRWADGFSAPLIRQLAAWLGYADFNIPGLGLLLTGFILWIVGLVTANVVGKRLLHSARDWLQRMPLVRVIYSPVRQLVESMASPDKPGFKRVVLVEYPRVDCWTLGFVAGDVPQDGGRPPAHSIFVPTAPNPTTGFMLIVPPEQLRDTRLSVEAAFQMIVSAGVAVPPGLCLSSATENGFHSSRSAAV